MRPYAQVRATFQLCLQQTCPRQAVFLLGRLLASSSSLWLGHPAKAGHGLHPTPLIQVKVTGAVSPSPCSLALLRKATLYEHRGDSLLICWCLCDHICGQKPNRKPKAESSGDKLCSWGSLSLNLRSCPWLLLGGITFPAWLGRAARLQRRQTL